MYTLLIAIIYLAFISLGLPDSLLGSAWPVMHADVNMSISSLGLITMLISIGTVISSLMSDKLTKRFSTQGVTTISVFLTAIALLGFSFSNSVWMLIIFALPYGLGAGAIDAALNNYVAVHYSSRHMSWLHCFWGVGAVISPFVMSFSLSHYSWNTGYRIISFIQFTIAFVLLFSMKLWKVNTSKGTTSDSEAKSVGLIDSLKIKGVPNLLLAFFCYCAAEGTAMGWACTYLVKAREMSEEVAAAYSSLFFIGMTLGRFLGGFIMDKLGDRNMIRLGSVIATLGITLLLIPIENNDITVIALIIIGLGCAPIYPAIIHSTPHNFGADKSGAIIGIQMASAYFGTTLVPPIYGLVGKIINFSVFPIYLLIFILMMAIMIERTFRITQNNH